MKTNILFLAFLSLPLWGSTSRELVVELKAPSSCLEVKGQYAKEPLVFNCKDESAEKLRYVSASFVGKMNTQLYMTELKKKNGISSVSFDQKVKRIE